MFTMVQKRQLHFWSLLLIEADCYLQAISGRSIGVKTYVWSRKSVSRRVNLSQHLRTSSLAAYHYGYDCYGFRHSLA